MGILARLLPEALKRRILRALQPHGEDKFSRVFNTSADWIVITRLSDGTITEANAGFEAVSGYRSQEALGQRLFDLEIWPFPEQRTGLLDALMRHGTARNHLITLQRRGGVQRECMVNCTLIAQDGAEPSHIVWIAHDVTEHNTEHEQFRTAFQLTPDFMSISRMRDGHYIEVNAAFEHITGVPRVQALGKTSTELRIWAEPDKRHGLIRLLEQDGAVQDFPMDLQARGQVREALLNAVVFESRGERYIIALLRDVTDARRAARALQESEARFVRLFDQSPLPMCYTSTENQFQTTQWNLAWFEAFGFDPVEDQGKSGLALNVWVDPEERARLLRLTASGQVFSDVEVQMRRRSGELRWISLSTRLFDEMNRTMLLFTYFDITERKRAQEDVLELNARLEARVAQRTAELQGANGELSQALDTLQIAQDQLVQSEKLAALGALVAGVAHELNTPIGNGLTVASTLEHRIESFQVLMREGLRKSDLQGFLEDMQLASEILVRNLGRAAALVAGFKQVAVDQTSSQRRAFDLAAVVGEILVTLNPALRKTSCAVSTRIEPDLLMDSYPGPLGQVLTNLINNAVFHGFAPGEEGKIEVQAWAQDARTVVIEVRDSGRGIAADHLHRVFEPFFTTRLGQGGSGLGLHIVHNLVQSVLGGRIEVHSRPGAGATFTVTLPMHAPDRQDSGTVPVSAG
ncbi:PAS domain S-box protein [uncultured Rhodoferax sp.]|uniref:PAS domain S-box protein n=1 Tax=uncultured Rhodoferax sp. TaxID=223188 RepID=UPI0025D9124C|nr:PAS domain S-box protein [uncultured Rhodoferax sp.]